jgi:hypothetical protein
VACRHRLGGREANGLEPAPYLRDVFDADPVKLDVLTVGDVGHIAAVSLRDRTDHVGLPGRQDAPRDPDPEHEVAVRLGALGVEAVPAKPVSQIGGPDGAKPTQGVHTLDPSPHVETVVLPLGQLGGVQRLTKTKRPLSLGRGTNRLHPLSWICRVEASAVPQVRRFLQCKES